MNLILDLLFPRRCVSCGRLGHYICLRCRQKIKAIEYQVCPVCERPAIGGATHPRCKTIYSLDGLASFFVYDDPVKKAIKQLKYRFVTDLASELVLKAFALPLRSEATKGFSKATPYEDCVLIPVPLHWRRQNWRGFNQSSVLGKLISEQLKIQFIPDLLIRKKYTQPQVELTGKKRKENIQDAFVINPRYHLILNTKYQILIFDDVWTTGSTLKSCAKVLKENGVKKVWAMTLAR